MCFQIAEALSYLHQTERVLHNNVNPQSILVTSRGSWKLAGLGFVAYPTTDSHVAMVTKACCCVYEVLTMSCEHQTIATMATMLTSVYIWP